MTTSKHPFINTPKALGPSQREAGFQAEHWHDHPLPLGPASCVSRPDVPGLRSERGRSNVTPEPSAGWQVRRLMIGPFPQGEPGGRW